jgi:hypothetical protein
VHRRVVEPLSRVLFIHMAVPFTRIDKGTVLVLYTLLFAGESIVKGNVVVVLVVVVVVVVDVVVVVVDVVVVVVVVVVITVNVPSAKTARLPAVSFR